MDVLVLTLLALACSTAFTANLCQEVVVRAEEAIADKHSLLLNLSTNVSASASKNHGCAHLRHVLCRVGIEVGRHR